MNNNWGSTLEMKNKVKNKNKDEIKIIYGWNKFFPCVL